MSSGSQIEDSVLFQVRAEVRKDRLLIHRVRSIVSDSVCQGWSPYMYMYIYIYRAASAKGLVRRVRTTGPIPHPGIYPEM